MGAKTIVKTNGYEKKGITAVRELLQNYRLRP